MYFAKHTARVSIRPAAGSGRPKPLKSGIPGFHLQQREIQTSLHFKIKRYKSSLLDGKRCMAKMVAGSPKPPQMVSPPPPRWLAQWLWSSGGERSKEPLQKPPTFHLDLATPTSRQAGMPYVLVRSSTNWSNLHFAAQVYSSDACHMPINSILSKDLSCLEKM